MMASQGSLLHRRRWFSRCISIPATSAIVGHSLCHIKAASSPVRASLLDIKLFVEGRKRSYTLYLPSAYDSRFAWPLVLAFHPFLYPNRVFERYAKLQTAAERDGYILAMPQGDGRGHFRSFNAGLRNDPNDPDDVAFAVALLNDLRMRASIDNSRIYAIGMSNGGMFAHLLAQDLPGVLAGIVTVSGSPANPIRPDTPPTPIMMVHGTADPITPWTGPGKNTPKFLHFQDVQSSFAQWCAVNRVAGQPEMTEYDQPGDVTRILRYQWSAPAVASAETVLLQVIGGGHRWPAAVRRPYIPFTGKQSTDVDFNRLAWDFLSRQSRT